MILQYVTAGLILMCVLLMWKVDSQSTKLEKANTALDMAQETNKKHVENIKITEEIANDHQNSINELERTLDRLQRTFKPECITIASPAGIHNEPGPGAGYDSVNGMRTDWLRQYAGTAEKMRRERNDCRRFVNRVWESVND